MPEVIAPGATAAVGLKNDQQVSRMGEEERHLTTMSSPRADRRTVKIALSVALGLTALPGGATSRAANLPPDACALARARENDGGMHLPFEVFDGRIYVQARVNGRGPFRFAVDTGASGMARADSSLVSTLKLAAGERASTSDGIKKTPAATVTLDSLEVGGVLRRNIQVITRNYSGRMPPWRAFQGILGRAFFGDGLLTIDYPRKTLSFSRKRSLQPGQQGTLHYDRAFRIPVRIGNVQTEGNLDTGANVAFVLPQGLFEKVGGTPLRQDAQGQLTNSRIDIAHAIVHGPIHMGEASLSDVRVTVSRRYPELLVGAHALDTFTILIDQRSKSVALCP